MIAATTIVGRLLEDDADDAFDAKETILNDRAEQEKLAASGVITPETAMTAQCFYHRKLKYAHRRGGPLQARRNGRTKTWKTRPGEFQIPVKYGLRECFYINHTNAHEWSTVPLPTPA